MRAHARLQRRAAAGKDGRLPAGTAVVTSVFDHVLASPGRPLDRAAYLDLSTRLGHDFSRVRVHTDAAAAASAKAIGAAAYTVGEDVVFAAGQYQPGTPEGRRLLVHELTHVAQRQPATAGAPREFSSPDDVQERQAEAVAQGSAPAAHVLASVAPGVVYRQYQTPGPVGIRSPLLEEAATQLSDVAGGLVGRPLNAAERTKAAEIFGGSIDLAQVRLIPTDVLQYRTVGNNIRVPRDFTFSNVYMAQTLVHELTHVWHYQHGGTSYMSHSLQTQLAAGVSRGHRNFAYEYALGPRSSFFDFTPEQQASIVQNYFVMRRDQARIAQATGSATDYDSNHLGPDGFPKSLNAAERAAEITRELPGHERAIAQMRAALPESEHALMLQRASEVMQSPALSGVSDPMREVTPVKPILELRF